MCDGALGDLELQSAEEAARITGPAIEEPCNETLGSASEEQGSAEVPMETPCSSCAFFLESTFIDQINPKRQTAGPQWGSPELDLAS